MGQVRAVRRSLTRSARLQCKLSVLYGKKSKIQFLLIQFFARIAVVTIVVAISRARFFSLVCICFFFPIHFYLPYVFFVCAVNSRMFFSGVTRVLLIEVYWKKFKMYFRRTRSSIKYVKII